jgi:hypothetical protein
VSGFITDASEWDFMECTLDREGKLSFKLSKLVIVVYDDVDLLEDKVKKKCFLTLYSYWRTRRSRWKHHKVGKNRRE